MKRAITFFCLVVSVFFFCLNCSAQSTERAKHSFEDWEYVTNTTGLTLTGYLGREPEIEIPFEIHGIAVTRLGDEIFKNSSFLRSIVIPDSITAIGRTAFQGCSSLEDIHLPRRLARIEPYTFRYCTSLEKIELPEALTFIGEYSFSGCISLREIIMPNTVTSVGGSSFDDCSSLSGVTISNNVTFLGAYAFRNTPWLAQQTDEFVLVGNTILMKYNGEDSIVDIPYGVTMITDAFTDSIAVESINIPSTVTRIGPNAFRDAVNLKTILIPDTVTRIDSNAFRGCRSLRSINLPSSITILGEAAFRNCEKLTQVDLPPRLASISSYLLGECPVLTDVVIPSTVASINTNAFAGSDQVRLHVTYDSVGEQFAKDNLIAYTYYLQQTKDFIYSRNDDGIQILKYIGNLFEVDIPAEIDGLPVNRINTAAFQNNQIVRSVTIPDSVKTIGDWAFSYMESLEAVQMSAGLVSLGADAFTGAASLRRISFSDKVEQIGVEPFEGIDRLIICIIPGSYAEQTLGEMGYSLSSGDACNEDPAAQQTATPVLPAAAIPTKTPDAVLTDAFTSTPTATSFPTNTPTVTPTLTPTMTPTPELINLLYIPNETEVLTADMLENTAIELTLVIPANVHTINDDIMKNHILTIVSDINTEAEAFARKNDIKFLVAKWFEMDYGIQENNQ